MCAAHLLVAKATEKLTGMDQALESRSTRSTKLLNRRATVVVGALWFRRVGTMRAAHDVPPLSVAERIRVRDYCNCFA